MMFIWIRFAADCFPSAAQKIGSPTSGSDTPALLHHKALIRIRQSVHFYRAAKDAIRNTVQNVRLHVAVENRTILHYTSRSQRYWLLNGGLGIYRPKATEASSIGQVIVFLWYTRAQVHLFSWFIPISRYIGKQQKISFSPVRHVVTKWIQYDMFTWCLAGFCTAVTSMYTYMWCPRHRLKSILEANPRLRRLL